MLAVPRTPDNLRMSSSTEVISKYLAEPVSGPLERLLAPPTGRGQWQSEDRFQRDSPRPSNRTRQLPRHQPQTDSKKLRRPCASRGKPRQRQDRPGYEI